MSDQEQHANDGYEPSGASTVVPPNVMPGALREQLAAERGGDTAAAGAGATPAGHSGETGNALEADTSGGAGGSTDYNDQSVDDLQAEADSRGLTVEGTGANGNVLKADLMTALEEDDAAKAA